MTEPLSIELSDTSTDNENEIVVRTALAAAQPTVLAERGHYAFRTFDGDIKVVVGPDPLPAPDRKKGTARLLDADSFAAYFLKHHEDDQAEIYAEPGRTEINPVRTVQPSIVGVLNGFGGRPDADVEEALGFADHRVELVFRHTPAWTRWAAPDGKLVNQVQFAQHLEDSLPDIVEPEGAQLLELAQSFQAHTKVAFESAHDLGSGQRQLVYREETTASAGKKGDITIPREFVVGIAPYEGSPPYRLTARLRYQIREGSLSIGYALDRPEDVLRAAFDDVLKRVQDETGRTALLGTPPA
jgi:uncharacterized protein YfdQ (DUF2303 family)